MAAAIAIQIFNHVKNFGLKSFNEVFSVEDDVSSLRNQISKIVAELKDAEHCAKKTEVQKERLKNLRDAFLDGKDVLETYEAEDALREINQLSPVDWWISRWIAAKNIKKILQNIEKSQLQNCSTEGTGNSSTMNYPDNRPDRDNDVVIGRQVEKDEIVEWLVSRESSNTDECIPVITITGMAGVGKTTLAQLVYNDEKVFKKNYKECHFKKAAWVHVSADFNVDTILKDIADMLTKMVHRGVSREFISNTIADLLGGSPLLLVLDDVWVNEKLAWQELHDCLNKNFPKGTKVLVTSRDRTVATSLSAKHSHHLGTLTKKYCLELFCKEVYYNGETDLGAEKEAIGIEIIETCQFLPLAVKLMGGVLSGREIQYWERTTNTDAWKAAKSLGDEGLSNITHVLSLSFDDLCPILKKCFEYTSLFPKGHMFDKHELVKLWIAEGFIQNSTSVGMLEQHGDDYFDKLCSRSFFQFLTIDSKKRFKMHDLIHDFAKHVSTTSKQVEDMNGYDIDTTCRHASFLCKDIEKSTIDKLLRAQKLRTLLLPVSSSRDFSHALNKMFQTLRYMRVLDLNSSSIIELPESIAQLKLLHYLDLSRNEIRLLPRGICKLLSLQILKLGCTWLQELPNDFGNLKDLRHLELDDMFWYKCSKLPPRLGVLTSLHNLHRFHVHLEDGYKIEELKSMNIIEGLLHISNLENTINPKDARLRAKTCINRLILEWSQGEMSPQDQRMSMGVLEDLQPHKDLKELQIEQYKGSSLSDWMVKGMLKKLCKISLNHCVNCEILSLGFLPDLQVLHIKGMLKLKEWPNNTLCPSLTQLTISHCPKLQKLLSNSFLEVHDVKIKQCDALKTLPTMPCSKYVTLINNALLVNLPFSTPIELEMVNCPRLMTLPPSYDLQKLKIRGCPSLKALPSEDDCQQLQYLEVGSCDGPSLIKTIQKSSSLDALTISNISDMPLLPKLPNFPSLRSFYIHNCQQLESLSDEDGLGLLSNLTSLKFLSISECRSLTIFPDNGLPTSIECLVIKKCSNLQSMHGTNNNYLTNLSTLKDLYLEDCPKLVSLPEDGLPNSLKHLCIRGCSLLTEYCHGGRYWDMISNVATCESEAPLGCFGF